MILSSQVRSSKNGELEHKFVLCILHERPVTLLLLLLSSSYSSAASDSEKEQQILSGIMSRRSLRLDDGLLDRSLPLSSASFSVGGGGWRNAR